MDYFSIVFFLLLLSRWCFLKEGTPSTRSRFYAKSFVDLIILGAYLVVARHYQYTILITSIFLLVTLFSNFLIYKCEYNEDKEKPGLRAITLLLLLSCLPLFMLIVGTRLFPSLGFPAGLLLCTKESNFIIRWFFTYNKLTDTIKDKPDNRNGRIIGNLERLLLYVFIFYGSVAAASVVIGIKGLARFKKMEEDSSFAEYVVIGTFLSVLLTLAVLGLSAR